MNVNSNELMRILNDIKKGVLDNNVGLNEIENLVNKSTANYNIDYKEFLNSKKFLASAEFRKKFSITDSSDEPTQIILDGDDFQAIQFLKNSKKKIDCVIITIPNSLNMVINGNHLKKSSSNYTNNYKIWLSYRLKAVKEILSPNGVIVVQVKDKVISLTRNILDSIFLAKNYVSTITWNNKNISNQQITINSQMEFAIVYSMNKDNFVPNRYHIGVSNDDSYKYSDDFEMTRGKYKRIRIETKGYTFNEDKAQPLQFLPIDGFEHHTFYVGGSKEESDKKIWNWTLSYDSLLEAIDNHFIEVYPDSNGVFRLWKKQYQFVDDNDEKIIRKANYSDNFTEKSKATLKEEAKKNKVKDYFQYTTPLSKEVSNTLNKATYKVNSKEFIKYLLNILTNPSDTILHLSSEIGSVLASVIEMNDGLDIENPTEDFSLRTVISVPNNLFNEQYTFIKSKFINQPQPNRDNTLVDFKLAVFKLAYKDFDYDVFSIPSYVHKTFISSLLINFNTFSHSKICLDSNVGHQFISDSNLAFVYSDFNFDAEFSSFVQMILKSSKSDSNKKIIMFLSEIAFNDINSSFPVADDILIYPFFYVPEPI